MIYDAGALIFHALQQTVMGKLLCILPCGMWSVWGLHNNFYKASVELFLLTVEFKISLFEEVRCKILPTKGKLDNDCIKAHNCCLWLFHKNS